MEQKTIRKILMKSYDRNGVEENIDGISMHIQKNYMFPQFLSNLSISDKTNNKEYVLYSVGKDPGCYHDKYYVENVMKYFALNHEYLSSIEVMNLKEDPFFMLTTEKRGENLAELQEKTLFTKLDVNTKLGITSQILEGLQAIHEAGIKGYSIYLQNINLLDNGSIFIRYSPKVHFVDCSSAGVIMGSPEISLMNSFPSEKLEKDYEAEYIFMGGFMLYHLLGCKDSEYRMPRILKNSKEERAKLATEIEYDIKTYASKYAKSLTEISLKALYCHPQEEYGSLGEFMEDIHVAYKRSKPLLKKIFGL